MFLRGVGELVAENMGAGGNKTENPKRRLAHHG
jgi:hypothetical protein